MMGKLFLIGLGPGDGDMQTPQAAHALTSADDIVGYKSYIERLTDRLPHQSLHLSGNGSELARARHALALASSGRTVAVVSGGDAGVFAMAAAVFEAIESGEEGWRSLDVEVIPGISAVLAVAARLGAPLGNDFCVLSLSDNLKPWELVLQRVTAAARAGFVLALYNPASRARPWQLPSALARLREILSPDTPVAFATAVTRAQERIAVVDLAHADEQEADMSTLVLVGTKTTRRIERPGGTPWLYTRRSASEALS